jgi:metal-responsive CopG/Arc/MetJ family transcriptional regulator
MKRTVEIKLTLPIDMAADLDLLLFDPVRGKVQYGARSHLIKELLRPWIAEKKASIRNPIPEESNAGT